MFFVDEITLSKIRDRYPIGTVIELVSMDDPQAPPVGTQGVVNGVDDAGNILVSWDNGNSLNVIYGKDVVKKIKKTNWDTEEKAKAVVNQYLNYCYGDRFLLKPSGILHWVYWNPDSDANGQFVINRLQWFDILDAVIASDDGKDVDKFFDYLSAAAKQTLLDNGSEDFVLIWQDFFTQYQEMPIEQETVNTLVKWANIFNS